MKIPSIWVALKYHSNIFFVKVLTKIKLIWKFRQFEIEWHWNIVFCFYKEHHCILVVRNGPCPGSNLQVTNESEGFRKFTIYNINRVIYCMLFPVIIFDVAFRFDLMISSNIFSVSWNFSYFESHRSQVPFKGDGLC